tara:strand:- start:455 stop:829 length:375 start_codon:yes stop_codon:yes gene_type:complete
LWVLVVLALVLHQVPLSRLDQTALIQLGSQLLLSVVVAVVEPVVLKVAEMEGQAVVASLLAVGVAPQHPITEEQVIMGMMEEMDSNHTQVTLVVVEVVQVRQVATPLQVAVDQAVQGAMVELIR